MAIGQCNTIKYIHEILKKWLKAFIFLMFRQFYNIQSRYKTKWIEDVPIKIHKKTVYILGGKNHPFQVIMRCPRFCKKNIYLNISKQYKKRWNVVKHKNGTISISPSIWIKDQCNCHYWFRKGRIFWYEFPNAKQKFI